MSSEITLMSCKEEIDEDFLRFMAVLMWVQAFRCSAYDLHANHGYNHNTTTIQFQNPL